MCTVNYFVGGLSSIQDNGMLATLRFLRDVASDPKVEKISRRSKFINLAYKSDDQSILLVKFDFMNLKISSHDWLADEEKFNDESPMYFSESSHRESPVFQLMKARNIYQKLYPEANIYLLLVTNVHIINMDEMKEAWQEIGVKVVHNVLAEPFSDFSISTDDDECLCDDEVEGNKDKDTDTDINCDEDDADEDDDDEDEDDEDEDDEDDFSPFGNMNAIRKKLKESLFSDVSTPSVAASSQEPCTFDSRAVSLYRGSVSVKSVIGVGKSRKAMTAFNIAHLEKVSVVIETLGKGHDFQNNRLTLKLYNEKRECVGTADAEPCHSEQNKDLEYLSTVYFKAQLSNKQQWKRGSYVLEVLHQNVPLTVVTFVVGKKNVEGVYRQAETEDSDQLEHPFEELDRMIGIREVKAKMTSYRDVVRQAEIRRNAGLTTNTPPLHAVFMGSPGTGKTTAVKIYASILKSLGLLSTGKVVYKERKDFVGRYYGMEEEGVREALNEAEGGVLFIDEAYNLFRLDDPKDPGKNVVEALLTTMSDAEARDIAIVFGGYTNGMADLLASNEGLSSRIPESNRFVFKDFSLDELMEIAESFCTRNNYLLTSEARKALQLQIAHDYRLRDENFGNARYVHNLLETQVVPAMSARTTRIRKPSLFDLITIEKSDIPRPEISNYEDALSKLNGMIGLNNLKNSIGSHLNMVKLAMVRNEKGMGTAMPPLHMVFTGNPGTGKTTVAGYIGKIYASLGLLSKGDVIYAERKDLVGQYVGETEKKTAAILNRAKGNVLFIDEAYSLAPRGKASDYGPRAIEVLLTALSKEQCDMIVILAGYPKDMEEMLCINPGLKSRIPYTFHFSDFSLDELMQLADKVAADSGYSFSAGARSKLRKVVGKALETKDAHWGNARYVTRLISAHIVPAMCNRLAELPPAKLNKRRLSMICSEDIPDIEDSTPVREQKRCFNEAAIKAALDKLDSLVGLEDVKRNIHNFVNVARYMHSHGKSYIEGQTQLWNFTGNCGTGKSTVAAIMGELFKAMDILDKGHITEVNLEEICHEPEHKFELHLAQAAQNSLNGLLFIDGDSPIFKRHESAINSDVLRLKLCTMIKELPGSCALIIAENNGVDNVLNSSLRNGSTTSFDHTLHFADYSSTELHAILTKRLNDNGLSMSNDASHHMATYIEAMCENREDSNANARTMSTLAQAINETYALRVSNPEGADDGIVKLNDVCNYVWSSRPKRKKLGFT